MAAQGGTGGQLPAGESEPQAPTPQWPDEDQPAAEPTESAHTGTSGSTDVDVTVDLPSEGASAGRTPPQSSSGADAHPDEGMGSAATAAAGTAADATDARDARAGVASDSDAEAAAESAANQHPPRNMQAWLACGLGVVGFVLVLAVGHPIGMFLGIFALSFGISAWVRVRRGMATVRRPAQAAVLLALATFGMWVLWYYTSLDCRDQASHPDELTRCVEDHTGLF